MSGRRSLKRQGRSGRRIALSLLLSGALLTALVFFLSRAHLFPFPPAEKVILGELKRGESLSTSLQSQGLSPALITSIIQTLHPLFDFQRSQPEDRYRLVLDGRGEIRGFTYQVGLLDSYEIRRVEGRLQAQRRTASLEGRRVLVEGTVEASLFEALEDLGEQASLVMDFARIFLWDIDFNTDLRGGDRFRMVVEKFYLGDQFVKYGRILIAQYENQGRIFIGIHFKDSKGNEGYFTPEGRSVKKALLRSPLEFNRISSRFTRSRLHPILGGYRPHLAVDYSAPRGAPVWAVADGSVASCGWSRGNGNCIILRHRMGLSTYYNHLSRFAKRIHKGARVKQRQVIAYVGSTGMSTGPHLDYRIKKDGRFINPLQKLTLPGIPVAKADQPRFLQARGELVGLLHKAPSPKPDSEQMGSGLEKLSNG